MNIRVDFLIRFKYNKIKKLKVKKVEQRTNNKKNCISFRLKVKLKTKPYLKKNATTV